MPRNWIDDRTAAVVFDAVGTLLHPEPPAHRVYAEVGRRRGSRLDDDTIRRRFRAAFARQEEVDRAAGWRTDEGREVERWRRIVAETLDDLPDPSACFRELYDHFARPSGWRVDADAGPVLSALRARGLTVGVASNFDERLRSVLAGFPLLADLSPVVVSAEVGWRKPAPAFFAVLVGRCEVAAGRVLLVGDDRGNDYYGARAAGLWAVLLDPTGKAGGGVDRVGRLAELVTGGAP
jgi:putative hydrolase of the HAD superfamily